ncbi:unnamed protein product [Ectocarpus sp. CCAP 1310/34]|nr:unnamed protein product [Ectocarpus sp. CCAP 1310/34]
MSNRAVSRGVATSTVAPPQSQARRTTGCASGNERHNTRGAARSARRAAPTAPEQEEEEEEEEEEGEEEEEEAANPGDSSEYDDDGSSSSESSSDSDVEVVPPRGAARTAAQPAAAEPPAKKARASSSAKAKSSKSASIWADFKLDPADNNFAFCKICPRGAKHKGRFVGRVGVAGGSTSAMHKHMNGSHGGVMASRQEGSGGTKGQQRLDGKVIVAPNFLRESIFWMLMTYSSLRSLENPWFRRMIASISPNVKTTSRCMIYEEMNKMEVSDIPQMH